MDDPNGRMLACRILVAAVIARMANDAPDPLRFLTEMRDEVRAVIGGVAINGASDPAGLRRAALASADELFALMKPPSEPE